MKNKFKVKGKRIDTPEFVEGYYLKTTASRLGINDIPMAAARIVHVIIDDDKDTFWHVIPESIEMLDKNQILEEIQKERARQDEKWGEQNHPILDQVLLNRAGSCTAQRMCDEYEIPSEPRAKQLCEANFRKGTGTWFHILVEEISEAVSCLHDTEAMRKELIQTAAVVVAMIDSLDRNGR